jgi:hypothetical protein
MNEKKGITYLWPRFRQRSTHRQRCPFSVETTTQPSFMDPFGGGGAGGKDGGGGGRPHGWSMGWAFIGGGGDVSTWCSVGKEVEENGTSN